MNTVKVTKYRLLSRHTKIQRLGMPTILRSTPIVVLFLSGAWLSSCGSQASPSATSVQHSKSAANQYKQYIASVASPNPTTLWVRLTTGDVFYSSDGGSTWAKRTPSQWNAALALTSRPAPGPIPETVTADSAQMAQVLPGGIISVANSPNQGKTWQVANLPKNYPQGTGPVGVSFVNATDGWASVNLPSGSAFTFTDVFQTTDGGKTWSFETQINGAAGPVEFITPTVGFAAGAPAEHPLFGTTDGGKTWHALSLPIPSGDVAENITGAPIFLNSYDGFVYVYFEKRLGHNPLLPYMDMTTDGGKTWSQVSLPLVNGNVSAWSIVSTSDWFLIGPNSVMHTTDGGKTWTSVTPNHPLTNLRAAEFTSDSTGVALIDTTTCPDRSAPNPPPCLPNNGLVRTTDGGKTWQSLSFP